MSLFLGLPIRSLIAPKLPPRGSVAGLTITTRRCSTPRSSMRSMSARHPSARPARACLHRARLALFRRKAACRRSGDRRTDCRRGRKGRAGDGDRLSLALSRYHRRSSGAPGGEPGPPRTGYWLDFTPPPLWWIKEAHSGGQIVEQTTHIFDLARLLVGEVEEVYAVAARTERPDYPECDICELSTAVLRFATGAVGSISSTCLLRWPHRIGLHLFCDGMAIELTEFEIMVDIGQGRPVRTAQGDPFIREDRDFIDAVRGGPNRIRAPYAEALRTHRLATRPPARRASAVRFASIRQCATGC